MEGLQTSIEQHKYEIQMIHHLQKNSSKLDETLII